MAELAIDASQMHTWAFEAAALMTQSILSHPAHSRRQPQDLRALRLSCFTISDPASIFTSGTGLEEGMLQG